MADIHANASPISQVLSSLGLTREDLMRHSDQMRQFLDAQNANSQQPFAQKNSQDNSITSRRLFPVSNASKVVPRPPTPVKDEYRDAGVGYSTHKFDSMEAVMERKSRLCRQQRKRRKEAQKERISDPQPFLLPNRADSALDSSLRQHDSQSLPAFGAPSPPRATAPVDPPEPAPVTPHHLKYYRDHVTMSASIPRSQETKSQIPIESPTPQNRSFIPIEYDASPIVPKREREPSPSLLPSSSPRASSPLSSPGAHVVNVVSSPGPMGPAPTDDDYGNLPFTLPPGPYSEAKPELSYSAIIGRAILSSPEHRLTLQEIYEWITIVFPHFKRGEPTWMNSIRHVLSTTACFRKVPRSRAAGRTLWAIWDEDLKCFENGGFNKQFCSDMMNSTRSKPQKRRPTGASPADKGAKRSKKARTSAPNPELTDVHSLVKTYSLPSFTPIRSTPQHQPYYADCYPQPTSMEIIFPPLPPSSSYRRCSSVSASSVVSESAASTASASTSCLSVPPEGPRPSVSPAPSETSSFHVSMPDLIPSHDSSSPPSDEPTSADPPPIDGLAIRPEPDDVFGDLDVETDGNPSELFEANFHYPESPMQSDENFFKKFLMFKPVQQSPSPLCRRLPADQILRDAESVPERPSTPPNRRTVQLNPHQTPISHKGLHMSPSPSLAHYKSNLDPPPVVSPGLFSPRRETCVAPSALFLGNHHTQTRGPPSPGVETAGTFHPVTPKKFPSFNDLFRTPDSSERMATFDPYDPRAMLEEEMARLGTDGTQDSPVAGLYSRESGMLYESPCAPSPSRLLKW